MKRTVWRIRQGNLGWLIEEFFREDMPALGTAEFWRVRAYFPSGAEAIAAFAAGGR